MRTQKDPNITEDSKKLAEVEERRKKDLRHQKMMQLEQLMVEPIKLWL